MIDIAYRVGETRSWEEFQLLPAPAIALDGYVPGPTMRDETGHWSFNHHEGVDRFATRAACEQTALAIRFGAFEELCHTGRPVAYVNHVDEDVCLALWLLRHPEHADHLHVNRLVITESLFDATAGCASGIASEIADVVAWVFEPYWSVPRPDTPEAMAAVVDAVSVRLDVFAQTGRHGKVSPHWSGYEVLRRVGRVAAVHEVSPRARTKYRDDGIDVFVAVKHAHDDALDISIGRTSPFVAIDLRTVFEELNRREPAPDHTWGGGDLVGGSPRTTGTLLAVHDIMNLIVDVYPSLAKYETDPPADRGVLGALAAAGSRNGSLAPMRWALEPERDQLFEAQSATSVRSAGVNP